MKNILEIGCGKGRYSEFLRKKYKAQVFGIDIYESAISLAKEKYPLVNFAVMSAEELQFDAETFDEVYAMDVLEHVDDLPKTIMEITRVLAKKGRLIINIPSKVSEQWLTRIRKSYPEEMHHVRVFEDNEIETLLSGHGYQMNVKRAEGFSDHAILYYLFKKQTHQQIDQTGIGNWRDTFMGRILFILHALLKPNLVFQSPLKYIPIWVITLPIGYVINFFGNKYMPKSWYYEFRKL